MPDQRHPDSVRIVRSPDDFRSVAQEPALRALLGLPPHVAVATVMPLGRPVRRITKLKRKPVAEFVMLEKWGGPPLQAGRA